MKSILLPLLLVVPLLGYGQSRSFYFDKAQANLLDSSAQALESFYKNHLSDHTAKLKLEGYSDTVGRQQFNQQLTADRIATVVAFLSEKGYPEELVQVSYMGEVPTEEGEEWKNRRVHMIVEAGPDLYEKMLGVDHNVQTMQFRNNRDTILKGAEGTSLILPKQAFIDKNGNTVKEVTIKLQEYYKLEDIVLSKLNTLTTDGQLMETNGMLNIKAYDKDGNRLKLASGKSIDLTIPEVSDVSKMKIYRGKKSGKSINWVRRSEAEPLKYGVLRTKYTYVQKRKRITSQRAIAILDAYLKKNLRYPENAVNNNRCGRVKVEFYIDADGNLVSPTIKGRGLPEAINKHVMQVMKGAPKLHPSYFKDKRALKFKYSFILKFYTERCFRKFNTRKYEVMQMNWVDLQPTAYWQGIKDAQTLRNASNVLFRASGLGMHNIDQINRMPQSNFSFTRNREHGTVFKLVMLEGRIVLNGKQSGGRWDFKQALSQGDAWLVGLKYKDDQAYFIKKKVDLAKRCPDIGDFKAMSNEEIRKEVRMLRTEWLAAQP